MPHPSRWLAPIAFSLAACAGGPSDQTAIHSNKQRVTPAVTPAQVAQATLATRQFGLDLYQQLAGAKQNVFFSPHSIAAALLMTYAGARTTTATEMRSVLHLSLTDSDVHATGNALDLALMSRGQGAQGKDGQPFRLKIANATWSQKGYPFLASYLDLLAENYGAGLNVVDFVADAERARATINGWVAERTEDKVKDLLPQGSVSADTRLVLTNAIYFNAAWADPFEEAATTPGGFATRAGATVTTPTMHRGLTNTSLYQGSGVTAVSVPYDGNELSMVIIRPDDLAAFEAALSSTQLETILVGLAPHAVMLHLPRWKVTDETPLKAPLAALGMEAAFGDADFSGIDGTTNLVITDVRHKAFVAVDEKGTEAAAATAVIIGETSAPLFVDVAIDRPFLYLIRDNATGAIVFFGRTVDPTL